MVVLVVVTVGYYKWSLSSCNGCSGSISSSVNRLSQVVKNLSRTCICCGNDMVTAI